MKISCGASHSMFLDIYGNLWVTGKNDLGQLGIEPCESITTPIQVEGASFCGIVAACYSSLALDDAGQVFVTGSNKNGHLGLVGVSDVIGFHLVENLPIIRFISCLSSHTMLIDIEGNVWVSGKNQNGQLGLGDKFDRDKFEQIPNLPPVRQVSAGLNHSLILTEEGDIYAIGSNYSSQLGLLKTFSDFTTPKIVTDIPKMNYISTNFHHSMFIDEEKRVWVTGQGSDGQLGLGSRNKIRILTKIPKLRNASRVSAGSNYSLVLDETGRVWMAGNMIHSHRKQVSSSHRFFLLEKMPKIMFLYAAKLHMLFVDEDGGLWASGSNLDGQLGQGKSIYELRTPANVRNLPPIAFPAIPSCQKSARK